MCCFALVYLLSLSTHTLNYIRMLEYVSRIGTSNSIGEIEKRPIIIDQTTLCQITKLLICHILCRHFLKRAQRFVLVAQCN